MSQEKSPETKEKKPKSKAPVIIGAIVLLSICAPYCYYAYEANVYGNANKPEGFYFPQFKDLYMTLIGGVVCFIAKKITIMLTYNLFYAVAKKTEPEDLRVGYAEKAAHKLYQMIYFVISTYWGWSVLKDTDWLPWYLGGMKDGKYSNLSQGFPFAPYPRAVYEYSLYTFGFHMEGLVGHALFDERKNDYEEMFLHHVATCSLYFGYIFSNFMGIGSIIAYLHDIADIFAHGAKVFGSTKYQGMAVL